MGHELAAIGNQIDLITVGRLPDDAVHGTV
jgi:hypothetical protein